MAEPHWDKSTDVLRMDSVKNGPGGGARKIGLKSKQTTLPTNHCILIPDIPVLENASILGKEPPNLLLKLQHSGDGTHCL